MARYRHAQELDAVNARRIHPKQHLGEIHDGMPDKTGVRCLARSGPQQAYLRRCEHLEMHR